MALFLPSSRVFGLEIGDSFIRTAVVSQSQFSQKIQSVAEIGLSRNPWLKNGLRDKELLAKEIRRALTISQPKPISTRKVVASLPEWAVFSKVIQLPKVSHRELIQSIPFEAAEFLPLPLEEVYLDWHIDDEIILVDGKPNIHVLIVAAPKHLIDDLREVCEEASLELVALESEPFALARSVQHHLFPDTVIALAHLDHRITTLVLLSAQSVKFTATIPVGAIRLQHHLKNNSTIIAEEIDAAIKYYQNRLGEKDVIKHLLLTGSGAALPKLPEMLHHLTRLKTAVGYSAITLPNQLPIHPRFNAVIGLALRQEGT